MTDRNRILQKTSGGLDVFTHYMGEGCKNRMFRNPYRKDGSPSCHLYCHKSADGIDKYVLKDFGDSQWYGDCFWLVAKLSGLNLSTDFSEVLHIIDRELNLYILDDSTAVSHQMMQKVQPGDAPRKSSSLKAKPVYQVLTKTEKNYWGQYGITPDVLNCYNVKSVLYCKFLREDGSYFSVRSSEKYPFFAYQFNNGAGLKFYRPGAQVRFLYSGTLPRPYIFGLAQLPAKSDILYITGGEKDVMALASHGFSAISLNSETAKLPVSLCETFLARFNYIIFLYDCDETGLRESALRVRELDSPASIFRVVLPLAGTKAEKDVSDFFRLGHTAEELSLLVESTINNEKDRVCQC